jgi:hypothetical protein
LKHLSTPLFSGLFSIPAYAQNGFYLSPSVRAGMSSSSPSAYGTAPDGSSILMDKTPIPAYNMQIGVGYQYKSWRFQSGIQYFSSGFKVDGFHIQEHFTPVDPLVSKDSGSYNVSISQIGIPLQVGYALPLSN